jgi:hypothetical protein
MSWVYVPALAGLNSESISPSEFGERAAAASVMWRGKQQPSQAWSRRWKQAGFIRRLSGLTCEISTLDRSVVSWISSLQAIRAKETQLQVSAWAPRTSASLRPRLSASPTSAGLILSSVKMFAAIPTDSSPPSSPDWKASATALRREYSARRKLATQCAGSDCSSWPAPDTQSGPHGARGTSTNPRHQSANSLDAAAAQWRAPSDISKRGGSQPPDKRAAGGHSVNLEDQAEHWKAPNVPMGGRSITHAEKVGSSYYANDGKKVQFGLERQVESWAAPSTRDYKSEIVSDECQQRRLDHPRCKPLSQQATNWSAPKASDAEKAGPNMWGAKGDFPLPRQAQDWQAPAQITWAQALTHLALVLSPARRTPAGLNCSPRTPSCAPLSQKRKLNPLFVEALMRWPIGLSGFERAETALTHWRQQQLSYLSTLCFQKQKKAA